MFSMVAGRGDGGKLVSNHARFALANLVDRQRNSLVLRCKVAETFLCRISVTKPESALPDDYPVFLSNLKERIRTAQVKAALAVNQELVILYWEIGREILERQAKVGWGAKVVEQLAKDLKREFPDIKGLSRTNLMYMRAFAEVYPDRQIVQQLAAQIPWFHNCILLDKVKESDQRLWYIQQTIENGWSRSILELQIESGLYQRQGVHQGDRHGGAVTNFERTLPKPQSDLAQSLLKDPYSFGFLTIADNAREQDVERALVGRIRDFLLELGVGFAFMGSQYPIVVDDTEYRLDLLFYHVKLRCYVIIDLKMREFQPEHSGKMNFYIAAVDNLMRHPDDNPTIGLILCKSKKKTTVEYSLQNTNSPIGVSTHRLPTQLEKSLPSAEEIEKEMDAAVLELEGEE
jgi:predicted nuclease of restriction endonuclease-like (RecB) superfamily